MRKQESLGLSLDLAYLMISFSYLIFFETRTKTSILHRNAVTVFVLHGLEVRKADFKSRSVRSERASPIQKLHLDGMFHVDQKNSIKIPQNDMPSKPQEVLVWHVPHNSVPCVGRHSCIANRISSPKSNDQNRGGSANLTLIWGKSKMVRV